MPSNAGLATPGSERSTLRVPAQDGAPGPAEPAGQFPSNRIAAEDEPLNCRSIGGQRHRRASRRRDNDAVRSGFCQGVVRDSVLADTGTSVALAIRPRGGPELAAVAISKEEPVRKLIATIAAALALAGVGLATHTTTSDAPADAWFVHILPYIEQDNLFRVS